MGCGCGGGKKKRTFEVTRRDGSKQTVPTRAEALALVRKHGGTWKTLSV